MTAVQATAAQALVTYRKANGLTQKMLGDMLDVTQVTVARWETGSNIADKLLPRVSDRTGISRAILRPDLARLLNEGAAS